MKNETHNCSQKLRAVGQLLEALKIDSFSMRADDDDFLVRDRHPRRNREIRVRDGLGAVWGIMRDRDLRFEKSYQSTGVLQFRVTEEDVALLERHGQTRRQGPGKVPDIGAPSQILRAIGHFVDYKRGRLLEVSKNDQDVYFEYELPSHETVVERFTVSSLYDHWVKMYLNRHDRAPAKT
jgi:hypothetical protein